MAKILLIDDSYSVLSLTQEILSGAGHDVTACQSPRLLSSLTAGHSFDLVITDIYMPDKDGLEIIIELRKTYPGVPVIAMSGAQGAKDMLGVARGMGAAKTLRKPFTPEALLTAVTAVLAKSVNKAKFVPTDRRG